MVGTPILPILQLAYLCAGDVDGIYIYIYIAIGRFVLATFVS